MFSLSQSGDCGPNHGVVKIVRWRTKNAFVKGPYIFFSPKGIRRNKGDYGCHLKKAHNSKPLEAMKKQAYSVPLQHCCIS